MTPSQVLHAASNACLCSVNGDGSHNYCHFMIEILPRLLTLQNSGVKPDWYLIDAYLPFHLQSLQAFGIPPEKILYGAESVLLRPYRGIGLGHRFTGLIDLIRVNDLFFFGRRLRLNLRGWL